ncbi:hypothetical protein EDB81DRAFT_879021 [Dactylonectria macrodidyma]|uniref:Sporulation-specific protein Sps2p n=1 Tax=Dactylonectria macrodidyma TaxID=307937 RepID=A0A9P9JCT0_9HYPO|nr:hypothetical protein EDB81DRAFT_879021 [Dactylonectria macrodidyma]
MKDFSYGGFAVATVLQCWHVYAADCEPGSGYISLSSESDLAEISPCSIFDGDLTVTFDESEWNSTTVDLGDIATINGSLNIYPSYSYDKITVVAPNLRNITDDFSIYYYNTTSQISSVNVTFPLLEYVGGHYIARVGSDSLILAHKDNLFVDSTFRVWDSMMMYLNVSGIVGTSYQFSIDQNPSLFSLEANSLERVGDFELYIGDNQNLEQMEFNNLIHVDSSVFVTLNPKLEKIEFPKLEHARSFQFTENGRQVHVSLPRVVTAGNSNNTDFVQSQFSDVVKLDLGNLVNVTGGIIFTRNTFSALVFPSLRNMTGELTIEENQVLDTLALPRLDRLGSLVVQDNEVLSNVTANSLKFINSVEMIGNFTNVELFALEKVTGDFVLQGDPTMDCSWFDEHLFQKIVEGSYSCEGNHTKPDTERTPSTGSLDGQEQEANGEEGSDSSTDSLSDESPETSTGGLSTGAKAGIGAGSALGGIAIIGALLYMFWWRKKKNSSPVIHTESSSGKPELDGTGVSPEPRDHIVKVHTEDETLKVVELTEEGKAVPVELSTGNSPVAELSSGIMELDGKELKAEMGGNEARDAKQAS